MLLTRSILAYLRLKIGLIYVVPSSTSFQLSHWHAARDTHYQSVTWPNSCDLMLSALLEDIKIPRSRVRRNLRVVKL